MSYLRLLPGLALLVLLALLVSVQQSLRTCRAEKETLQTKLDLISNKKNQQKATTGDNIKQGNERIVYVDRIVRPLEQRPVPAEGCATPDLEEWKAVL